MSGTEGDGADGGDPMLARLFDLLRRLQEDQHAAREERRSDREEQRGFKREVQLMSATLLDLARSLVRMERRQSELKDDLDLVIRAELGGQLSLLRRELDGRFDDLVNRLDDLRDRVADLEAGRAAPSLRP